MLAQLNHVADLLNTFQDDQKNLSDCVHGCLLDNVEIKDDVQVAIRSHFNKTRTTWHILAYILDNCDRQGLPKLPRG